MIRDALAQKVLGAVATLHGAGNLPTADLGAIEIADTKQPEHGDYASNLAMVGAKAAEMNPRALGELLASELSGDKDLSAVEVAGPGFLNFRLTPDYLSGFVSAISDAESLHPQPSPATPSLKINVEFVSVNPNGPITIGSGRGAAYGSTLCNVLQAAGHTVHREYYINDGVNSEQMRQFAESVRGSLLGHDISDRPYKGEYVDAVAAQVRADWDIEDWKLVSVDDLQAKAQAFMLAAQREALSAFSVEFDTWFSEQSLHDSGQVEAEVKALLASGVADTLPVRSKLKLAKGGKIEDVETETQATEEEDSDSPSPSKGEGRGEGPLGDTLWLRSTKFGDDMDRVLRRRDSRLTYIASDVAYHKDKFNRPARADKLITVLGPDHHGYIGRLTAVVAAMLKAESSEPSPHGRGQGEGADAPLSEIDSKLYASIAERDACQAAFAEAKNKLEVQIFQLVRFLKDGKPAPMRKRDGNIYALIDLINEIGERMRPDGTTEEKQQAGTDVARFFYLMRSHDTTFDFDLNLAETKSDENPVFYVQYAHARICSILAKAEESNLLPASGVYTETAELSLIKKITDLPVEIRRCAEDYGVHRLVTYAIELARAFHHFYNECRVIDLEVPEVTARRLSLCRSTQIALKATLDLLGVSAPERM